MSGDAYDYKKLRTGATPVTIWKKHKLTQDWC